MNKTKIDWADMTWNPVTGCLHDCPYCYARKITTRFSSRYDKDTRYEAENVMALKEPLYCTKSGNLLPYPFGFKPTFHKYRLDEPKQIKKPQNIFVCSMADLFGEWVPDEWISEVFKSCEAAPWHNYLFLTKNPIRYIDVAKQCVENEWKTSNVWLGTTLTHKGNMFYKPTCCGFNCFVSIEPICSDVMPLEWLHNAPDWVIIGAETGNRKGKVIPEKQWIDEIAEVCATYGTPVFMKESLRELMGDDFKQEFPDGLKR